MEGFLRDDEEMKEVAQFIEDAYGYLPERDDIYTLMGQAETLANLFAHYLPDVPVDRFVRLCAACRVGFQVRNRDGQIVADGMRMMMGH